MTWKVQLNIFLLSCFCGSLKGQQRMRSEYSVINPVFFLSFTKKNLCSFMVRTVECNSYYVFLLFFNNIMQKIF